MEKLLKQKLKPSAQNLLPVETKEDYVTSLPTNDKPIVQRQESDQNYGLEHFKKGFRGTD